MTSSDFATMLIIAGILQCIILYWIISSATRAATREWHQQMQLRLLARIAEKLGVPQDDIDNIFGKRKKS